MISNTGHGAAFDQAGPDAVTSTVQFGDQRGRLLGFPTANLHPARSDRRPHGVYAAVACAEDGVWWPAAVNVGTRPTFTDGRAKPSIEVHLIGFEGDLYGQSLTVRFLERLRDELKFESVDALVQQLCRDIEAAATIVAGSGVLGEFAAERSR